MHRHCFLETNGAWDTAFPTFEVAALRLSNLAAILTLLRYQEVMTASGYFPNKNRTSRDQAASKYREQFQRPCIKTHLSGFRQYAITFWCIVRELCVCWCVILLPDIPHFVPSEKFSKAKR